MSYTVLSLLAVSLLLVVFRHGLRIWHSFLVAWPQRILGFGSVSLISAPQTILLDQISKSTEKVTSATQQFSLRNLVEQITIPVRLNPFLFNGHIQTISVATGWTGSDCHIYYKRKIWQSDSEIYTGQFAIDFVIPPPDRPSPRDRTLPPRTTNFKENEWDDFIKEDIERPLVVILHGFLGGSHEKYVRHSLELLTAEGKTADFSVAVINGRGCSWSKITSPVMYHPRATWDLRQFVRWARRQWPHRRLFAVGFSIGANLLCNYLGEEGEPCELEAAVLVGNPWNLDVIDTILAKSLPGLHLYQRALGTAFKKAFERHVDMISQNPAIDVKKARESTFLWQWDRYVQCPTWGYPSEGSYYRDTSSIDAVTAIRTPVLVLHAKDDPVCLDVVVPYHLIESNPYLVICTTSIGGHLGWFEFGGGRWSNKMVGLPDVSTCTDH
ncbi:MAG: hypothetical protein M1820_006338 [Bogoriella megaspora]|nr:MAG: hypothetical protein M1820_006338 [Bogoriella megaspora]